MLAAWVMFFRGLFAVTLGVSLLIRPDVVQPFLVNFIGAFWISGGLLSVRWGIQADHSKHLTLLVALLGIMAGVSVMGRKVAAHWMNPDYIVELLGTVALLTGILHVSGQLTVRHAIESHVSRTGLVLGIVEIMLGLILLLRLELNPLASFILVGWALLGGFALLNDARLMHQETLANDKQEER